MASNSRLNIKYIYELPYAERTQLCNLLDQNKKWEELGGIHMEYSMMVIESLHREFLRCKSPTHELLTMWGHQNHTITELFVLLSKMHHYQAMLILSPFVDSKYHRLIYRGEENLSQSFKPLEQTSDANNIPARRLPLDSKVATDSSQDDAGLMSIAGAPESALPHKTMNYGRENINTPNPPANLLQVNKVELPPEFVDEEKIINVAENKENSGPDSNLPPRKLSNASDVSSVAESCGTIPHIPYKELVAATQGWDKQAILGKGGFGTVFKGTWKNTQVAIKRIEQRGAESAESYQGQMEQSLRELRILNTCRHDNILPVYGFSIGGDEPCLVYQFMPNGSLEDRLLCRKGSKPMTWLQRHNIAEGTARGLQFLHTNHKPFIHGDIKSANILLDVNLEPRIGDFGLTREGPQTQYTHMTISRVHGTRPYLPDEFLRSKKLSTKVDTFSYGIVLFELTTGLRAYDENRSKKFLKEYVEACEDSQLLTLIDRKAGLDDQLIFAYLVQLGKCCVSRLPKDRPEMEIVLKQLVSMTTKRDTAMRAQDMLRQKTPSPSTPYEMQVFHDYQSQFRQTLSPAINHQPPSFGRLASNPGPAEPNVQILPNVKHLNNPFWIFTPPQDQDYAGNHGLELNIPLANGSRNQTGSPTANWTTPRLSPLPTFNQVGSPSLTLPVQAPAISVSPTSASDRDSVTSTDDDDDDDDEDSVPNTSLPEEGANAYAAACDGLPLLSALGIKDNNSGRIEDMSPLSSASSTALSSSGQQPTAKGKVFALDVN